VALELRPHFLLELNNISLHSMDCDHQLEIPDWVQESLRRAPFVVVRRGLAVDGMVPVGVRGASRDQRFATFISKDSIAQTITPVELMNSFRQAPPNTDAHRALLTLAEIETEWHGMSLHWGPGGSVGFELATQMPTITATSDLDIVVYADERIAIEDLSAAYKALPCVDINIDIQIETSNCGFALKEYLKYYPDGILVKTPCAPVLCAHPWAWQMSNAAKCPS
jgi:phosphoribosyl-dephospho-CoA transferase